MTSVMKFRVNIDTPGGFTNSSRGKKMIKRAVTNNLPDLLLWRASTIKLQKEDR